MKIERHNRFGKTALPVVSPRCSRIVGGHYGFLSNADRALARRQFTAWAHRHGWRSTWTDYVDTFAPFAAQVTLWRDGMPGGYYVTGAGRIVSAITRKTVEVL